MNIEVYNLDSLRKLVRNLQAENCPKQQCSECRHGKWIKLTPEILLNHLLGKREDGTDVIGVYPLLPDGTCRFLVFDFDNHEKGAEETDFANDYEEWHDKFNAEGVVGKLHIVPADGVYVDALNLKPRLRNQILIATVQKIGEGFDFPKLDTLMLAAPVSYEGRLEQYVGRLNRDYEGKKDVIVYDYIDSHIPKFEAMYLERLRTYKKIGFHVAANMIEKKQNVNAIYDSGNYAAVFEQDLIEAEQEIIISTPRIIQSKISRLIYLMKLIRVRDERAVEELLNLADRY